MSNEQLQESTQTEQQTDLNTTQDISKRRQLLCRVVDVESSLLTAFQRFIEEKKSSLEDMMLLAKEELSKMELFAPRLDSDSSDTASTAEL